jgi:hypothetical protein
MAASELQNLIVENKRYHKNDDVITQHQDCWCVVAHGRPVCLSACLPVVVDVCVCVCVYV